MNYSPADIVVTGFSALTPAGSGLEPVLELLRSGGSALSAVPDDVPGGKGQMWGKALSFKATDFIPPLKARKMDRCSQFTVAASGLALKDAGIDLQNSIPERVGIALGCGFGGVANSSEFLSGYFKGGANSLTPMLFPNTVSNAPASNASIELGMKGPNVTIVQRFCSAESAFLMACSFIAEGRADVMLTGGADDLMPLMIAGFKATGQLRSYAASFGEGCGILVLESARHAAERGAHPKGYVRSIATVGLLPADCVREGVERLLEDTADCDLLTISGSVTATAPIMESLPPCPAIDLSPVIGRSLAMGGTSMAALLASLAPGQDGLHLAASPEGPYFAIRFGGRRPV
ncbi:MAG TPA: beta-ketoacyl synthase [Desulfuromonadales bacterium]|nr:beta-ketoacyl synthase [Desulfuromonadales bacterium]